MDTAGGNCQGNYARIPRRRLPFLPGKSLHFFYERSATTQRQAASMPRLSGKLCQQRADASECVGFLPCVGTVQQQNETQVEIRNFQGIYLSPQQAKALLGLLQQNVNGYETAFGEIKLDRG